MAERLAAQLLSGPPADSPVRVAERLLAVQAQDPRGARLAVRARTSRLTSADVDRALADERSVVVAWLNRGTLHLVRTEDYWWLHALTTPQLVAGSSRRLRQEGVSARDADKGVEVVQAALAAEGPMTRARLREPVAAAGVRVEGQALVHILFLASLRGLVVRGPSAGRDHTYVLVSDWLGKPPPALGREAALAELARRYLAGHGPACDRDLAKWAGLPLRDVRTGLAEIKAELTTRPDGLVDLADRPAPAPLPPPRLLGAFEPLLLGWTSREPFLPPEKQKLVADNGLFRPFALVRGRVVATWSLRRGGGAMQPNDVVVTPFAQLSKADRAALEADAADVVRFLAQPGHPSG